MVNEEATIDNVRGFFDHRLEVLLRHANCNHEDLRSPLFDGMPKAPAKGNVAENKMMMIETAREHVACVQMAIKKCEPTSQEILNRCYINQQNGFVSANVLGFSYRQFMRLKSKALIEFADRYQTVGELHGFNDTDLHIYISPEKQMSQ